MVATLCRNAGADRVSSGVGNRLNGTRSPATSAAGRPQSSGGTPLSAQVSGSAADAASASGSMVAGSGSGMHTSERQTTHTDVVPTPHTDPDTHTGDQPSPRRLP